MSVSPPLPLARIARIKIEDYRAFPPTDTLTIDLGPELGLKRSSAQITVHYKKEELVGKQVLCVCNFPPKQVGPFMSEVLTTGFYDENGAVILAGSEKKVPNGSKLA